METSLLKKASFMEMLRYLATRVYAYLPSAWFGGFDGMTNEQACSEMTNVSEEHWKEFADICEALIFRRMLSRALGTTCVFGLAVAVAVAYKVVCVSVNNLVHIISSD